MRKHWIFGWETSYDEDEDELYEEEIAEASPYKSERERYGSQRKSTVRVKFSILTTTILLRLCGFTQNILEVKELCDHLKANKPVI